MCPELSPQHNFFMILTVARVRALVVKERKSMIFKKHSFFISESKNSDFAKNNVSLCQNMKIIEFHLQNLVFFTF